MLLMTKIRELLHPYRELAKAKAQLAISETRARHFKHNHDLYCYLRNDPPTDLAVRLKIANGTYMYLDGPELDREIMHRINVQENQEQMVMEAGCSSGSLWLS